MLTFIQFISEGSSGQKALNRKRIATGNPKKGPSRWTSDIGHRMAYKSSMSLLRKNAKKNIKENNNIRYKKLKPRQLSKDEHDEVLHQRQAAKEGMPIHPVFVSALNKMKNPREFRRALRRSTVKTLKHGENIGNSDIGSHSYDLDQDKVQRVNKLIQNKSHIQRPIVLQHKDKSGKIHKHLLAGNTRATSIGYRVQAYHIDIKENTTLKTKEDQRRSALDHADRLRRKHLSRTYTQYKKEYGEPDRDSFEDGAAYLKHVPDSDLPSHIPSSKKMKTRDSRQPQVRVKKMDAALHNLRRKSIIARNASISQWHRDNKIQDRRKDIKESSPKDAKSDWKQKDRELRVKYSTPGVKVSGFGNKRRRPDLGKPETRSSLSVTKANYRSK